MPLKHGNISDRVQRAVPQVQSWSRLAHPTPLCSLHTLHSRPPHVHHHAHHHHQEQKTIREISGNLERNHCFQSVVVRANGYCNRLERAYELRGLTDFNCNTVLRQWDYQPHGLFRGSSADSAVCR